MGEAPCFAHMLDERGQMPDAVSIRTERVYGAGPGKGREARVLVDRIWPRGVRRDSLHLDLWAKELAPSTKLRQWFGHDPARWREFASRYEGELYHHTDELRQLAELARDRGLVLLYGAKDAEHNQAVVLKEVLEESFRR